MCLILSRIRGLYIEPDGGKYEAYGLPSASPIGIRQSMDGFRSLKESVRLQRDAMRIPMEKSR